MPKMDATESHVVADGAVYIVTQVWPEELDWLELEDVVEVNTLEGIQITHVGLEGIEEEVEV
jgi:hypothetical protein